MEPQVGIQLELVPAHSTLWPSPPLAGESGSPHCPVHRSGIPVLGQLVPRAIAWPS